MKIDAAHTFQSRLLFRISHEPTASARTLRAVIEQHGPDRTADGPDVVCHVCHTVRGRATFYPCPTIGVIALELGVPLPTEPTYGTVLDG